MIRKNIVKTPLISVIMPVYNSVDFVEKAIESIKGQTYKNWELIIYDDCSTDGSYQLVKKIAQRNNRIRVFRNSKNLGVAATANKALKKCRGQFIARMDSDDISLPSRLKKQLNFLLKNPDVVAVGTQCSLIDVMDKKIGEKRFPIEAKKIEKMIFCNLPVQQPSLMVNMALIPDNFVWYKEGIESAEEHELLFKFFELGKVTNLKQILLKYRMHGNNISLKNPKRDFYIIFKTRLEAIFKHNYKPSLYGFVINLMELAAVTLLPTKWIFSTFYFLRDLQSQNFKFLTYFFRLSKQA